MENNKEKILGEKLRSNLISLEVLSDREFFEFKSIELKVEREERMIGLVGYSKRFGEIGLFYVDTFNYRYESPEFTIEEAVKLTTEIVESLGRGRAAELTEIREKLKSSM
jgi:hypothetical protein